MKNRVGSQFLSLPITNILTPRELMKMQATKVNLMFVLALAISVACFFLMDLFVSADGNDFSIPCAIVSSIVKI